MKNVLTIFAFILTFTSCSNQNKSTQESNNNQQDKIENIHWTLVEFDNRKLPSNMNGKVSLYLDKKDNHLSGSDGCNRVMGNYKITDGTQITFSDISSSLMRCDNEGWNELEYHKMLETSNNFTVSGDSLFLHIGKRAPLAIFVKTDKNSLINKYWKLNKLGGVDIVMDENQEQEQYFMLNADGTLSGFAGCNSFSGYYTLDEENLRIKFDKVSTTLRSCPEIEVNESEFMGIFETADNYTLDGNTLRLNVGRRAPLAVFEAVYF